MTVIELRDALNALIEQGRGGLPVAYRHESMRGRYGTPGPLEYEPIDRTRIEEKGDENVPGPLIELE